MPPSLQLGHILGPSRFEARSLAGDIDDDVHRQIFVSASVGMTIAAITTLLRVALRFRRFWWDDGLALGALALLIVTAATGGLYYNLRGKELSVSANERTLTMRNYFDMTIWISRLSLMANIIRLGSYQKRLYAATALFLIVMLILVAQVFWVCEPQDRTRTGRAIQCHTDVFADIVLITAPLLLLRYMQSNEIKMQKLRLGVSFAVGGFTSIVSIVHAVYLLQNTQISIVVSNAELSVSVIISNFAVLVAAASRLWSKYHPAKQAPEHSTIQFGTPPGQAQKSTLSSDSVGDGGAFTIDIVSRGDESHSDAGSRLKEIADVDARDGHLDK
ncbi:hypothetical protein CPB85DRAFT_1253589 [Mucidula mucida]|nr:hypothetical protein CPB85DRAFT_1253589 [Mucidula mucida]